MHEYTAKPDTKYYGPNIAGLETPEAAKPRLESTARRHLTLHLGQMPYTVKAQAVVVVVVVVAVAVAAAAAVAVAVAIAAIAVAV